MRWGEGKRMQVSERTGDSEGRRGYCRDEVIK